MESTIVTHIWMGGVIAVMVFYGVVAIAWLIKRN